MISAMKEFAGFFKRLFRIRCCRQINSKKNQQCIMKSSLADPFICNSISSIAQTSRKQLTEELKSQTQEKRQVVLNEDFRVAAKDKRRQYILPKDYLQELFKEIQVELQSILQDDQRIEQQSKKQSDCFSQDYMKQYEQLSEQDLQQKINIEKQEDDKEKKQSEAQKLGKQEDSNKIINRSISIDAGLSPDQLKINAQVHKFQEKQPNNNEKKKAQPQHEYISSNIRAFLFDQPQKSQFFLKKCLKIRIYFSLLSRKNQQKLRFRFRRLFRKNPANSIHMNT